MPVILKRIIELFIFKRKILMITSLGNFFSAKIETLQAWRDPRTLSDFKKNLQICSFHQVSQLSQLTQGSETLGADEAPYS